MPTAGLRLEDWIALALIVAACGGAGLLIHAIFGWMNRG
jgi:hypothetical protein